MGRNHGCELATVVVGLEVATAATDVVVTTAAAVVGLVVGSDSAVAVLGAYVSAFLITSLTSNIHLHSYCFSSSFSRDSSWAVDFSISARGRFVSDCFRVPISSAHSCRP